MPGQAIVTINDNQWNVWVASTYAELTAGLSGWGSIPPGTGMLFVLPAKQPVTVDTDSMLFNIDIIFIADSTVISVAGNIQPGYLVTEETPCDMFLEVNTGEAAGVGVGDTVDAAITQEPGADPGTIISFALPLAALGFVCAIAGGVVKLAGGPSESKTRSLPQTGVKGKYEIDTDYMGNIIITRTDDPGKDVFLQFEADKDLVYDLLKRREKKDMDNGWTVTIKRSEPRASLLDELWESSAQPQSLPQTRKRKALPEKTDTGAKGKPSRHDIEIGAWAERDRMGIWITDKRTGKTIAEWWDGDAREMFEMGFFKPGDISHQTITGRAFEESVFEYAEGMGLLAGSGKYLPQTVRHGYYWTAVNKDTGEIVESFTPYTSSGRALRGGKAWASRMWPGDKSLVEVWERPCRYSEKLKIAPLASETVVPPEGAVVPTEPRPRRRAGPASLEFLPDSPEFLAYTIDDIGYRDKLDTAFQQAIARTRRGR